MNRLYEIIFRLKDDISKRLVRLNRLQVQSSKLADTVGARFKANFQKLRDEADRTYARIQQRLSRIGNMLKVVLVAGVVAFGNASIASARQVDSLEKSIAFASGNEAANNMAFLRSEIDRLGLDSIAATKGFQQLAGSFMNTRLAGKPMRDVFRGVAEAGTAMGLSADQQEGALLAISQMMSKGKVAAEELRGQLGERLPGAFQIAARSMGVTTAQLDKMLANGEILAEDFLPKFAKELSNTFGGQAAQEADGLNARLNRMGNAATQLKLDFFEAFQPLIDYGIAFATMLMENLGPAFQMIMNGLTNIYNFVNDNIVVFGALAAGILAYKGIVLATIAVTKAWGMIQAAVNAVMMANPLVLVISLIAALITGIVIAYRKFDRFRGLMHGVWEAFKEAFGRIGKLASAVGKILWGAVTFSASKISEGISDFNDAFSGAGTAIVDAFNKGMEDGMDKEIATPQFLEDTKRIMKGVSGVSTTFKPGDTDTGGAPATGAIRATGSTSAAGSGANSRPVNVNITIEKFQDQVTFNTTNLEADERQVMIWFEDMLARVVRGANQYVVTN